MMLIFTPCLISLSLTTYLIALIIYLLSNSNSHVKSKHYTVTIKYEKVLSKFSKSEVHCFKISHCKDLLVLYEQFIMSYYQVEISVIYAIHL